MAAVETVEDEDGLDARRVTAILDAVDARDAAQTGGAAGPVARRRHRRPSGTDQPA